MAVVKVTNTSTSKPLTLRHDVKGDITLAPGTEKIVEYEYATLAFGNPTARNEGRDRIRDAELAKLQTRYGFYPGLLPDAAWTDEITRINDAGEPEQIGPFCPSFEVHDLEGNRVYMILDDPDGTKGSGNGPELFDPNTADGAVLAAQVNRLEADLKRALDLLAAQAPDTEAKVPDTPAPTADAPTSGADAQAQVAASIDKAEAGDSGQRSKQSSDLPKPKAGAVKKDGPRTTRVGSR